MVVTEGNNNHWHAVTSKLLVVNWVMGNTLIYLISSAFEYSVANFFD